MARGLLLWFFWLVHLGARPQELNCKFVLQIDPRINRPPEQRVVEDIEKELSDFLNQNKWTKESFELPERIVCNFVVTVKENPAPNQYRAHAQLLSVRPIYGTDYQSVLLNYVDEGFRFSYVPGQPLQASPDFFSSNLESMLIFYAYLFIGLDFDSFAPLGGTGYFEKAQQVMTIAQQTNDDNWTSFGSARNRYWLVENLLRKNLEPFRTACYAYHRAALDTFLEDPKKARERVFSELENLEKTLKRSRNSIITTVFLDTKYQEIINLFSEGDSALRQKTYELMSRIDPGRTESYKEITQ